ncbi:ODV-E28 [Dikerogammarus haemobaphes nudivirus]|nr:ODV-E28 [Dikerogammarus haemobaphes nudivirus]
MLSNKTDTTILIVSIVLIFVIITLLISNKPKILPNAIVLASEETEFGSTYYEIYDNNSTSTVCDRLIIVYPFYWFVWAKNGLVYLLNATNQTCPINYTPSSLVPSEVIEGQELYNFKSVCIYMSFNDIVENYKAKTVPVKVKFDIKEIQSQLNKFTILDVLNDLFKNWITMDPAQAALVEATGETNREYLIKNYTAPILSNDKLQKLTTNLRKLNKKVAR